MIRTQVYLYDQQYHLARLFADEDGTPFAEFIRHGVELAIAERQRKQAKTKKPHAKAFDGFIGSIKAVSSEPEMDPNAIYDDVLPWDRPDWQGA